MLIRLTTDSDYPETIYLNVEKIRLLRPGNNGKFTGIEYGSDDYIAVSQSAEVILAMIEDTL